MASPGLPPLATTAPSSYPAYSPNVVAVGGTTLNLNSQGGYSSETGWSGMPAVSANTSSHQATSKAW